MPELIDFGLLRDTLREQFTGTFGGLVNNGDNAITIYETGGATAAMHDWVNHWFQDAANENGVDPALIPTVTYHPAGLSLDALFGLKGTVTAALGTLETLGIGVETIGVQDGTNKIIVGVRTPVALAQTVLEQLFGHGHIAVIAWDLTDEADRYNDSSPWNGGDQILSEGSGSSIMSCTTGFGMHNGAGDHFVTTAGHCGTHFWWNTWIGFPIRDSSTLLGVTSGSVWDGTYFGYDVDTQKIITNGSSNIVWTNTATRKYISAPLGVAQNDPTCIEGSFSLTMCGTVWATDFGAGDTEYVVLTSSSTMNGDSGAPSWRNSPFGPLAQGTHVGSISPTLRVELNVYAVMFFNGLALNTTSDP